MLKAHVDVVDSESTEMTECYQLSCCHGHIVLDATFLAQVEDTITCPYCKTEVLIPERMEVIEKMNKAYLEDELAPGSLMAGIKVSELINEDTTAEEFVEAFAQFFLEKEEDETYQINIEEEMVKALHNDSEEISMSNFISYLQEEFSGKQS